MAYVIDFDGRLQWWNERLSAVTGYSDEELVSMDVFELIEPSQRPDARRAFEHSGSFPPTFTVAFDIVTKDGETLPYEFNGSVEELDCESVAVGIGRDVTARRERETEIKSQRDELETLNRISETVYEVIQSVVDAASRDEIESVVCERLAASELYEAVWIGREEPGDTVEPHAGVGTVEAFTDIIAELNDLEWDRPAKAAIETGTVKVVQRISDGPLPERVKRTADSLNVASGTAVPIVHRGDAIGVLCVYSSRPEAFSGREQSAFKRLGEVIGFAIGAVQTERLLLSDTATELTFRVTSADAFLAPVSELADGPCRHEWSSPAGSGNVRHYISASGIDPEAVVEMGNERPMVVSVEHVGDNGDDHVFEVVLTDSLIQRLLNMGASPASIIARDGETTIVAELSGEADPRPVVKTAEELYDAELVSKRKLERPVQTADEYHDAVASQFTDQQLTALRHAFFSGYFSWPRDATAEDIADAMDISSPTLHYHIRGAERTLIDTFFQHLDY